MPAPHGGHLPLWTAQLFLLCVSLKVFATPTGRLHGRTLIRPSSPACAFLALRCAHAGSGPSGPPPPVIGLPWRLHRHWLGIQTNGTAEVLLVGTALMGSDHATRDTCCTPLSVRNICPESSRSCFSRLVGFFGFILDLGTPAYNGCS